MITQTTPRLGANQIKATPPRRKGAADFFSAALDITEIICYNNMVFAPVVELADTLDLGSNVERCAGSSPVRRTSIPLNLFRHRFSGIFVYPVF